MASYKKDDLCTKAAPPRHAPSPKGPVFVTGPSLPTCRVHHAILLPYLWLRIYTSLPTLYDATSTSVAQCEGSYPASPSLSLRMDM